MAAGRPPEIGEARSEFLRVRLAPSEIQSIDTARGTQSRSDFVRDAVISRAKRRAK